MNKKEQTERESIAGRVIEFLKLHSPFKSMSTTNLEAIADQSSIIYKDLGQTIFSNGDQLHDCVYIIRKGEVRIISAQNELVDICTEGQIFGARAFMASEVYQASAIADPEALLLKIPIKVMRDIIAHDPTVMEFFFGDFSSGVALRKRKLREINDHAISRSDKGGFKFLDTNYRLDDLKDPVTCSPETAINEAAQLMREHHVGSIIIVSESLFPLGIVTDTDLRNKVVTGEVSIQSPINTIMSHPVKTVTAGLSTEEYLLKMIDLGVHHLCVTQSGLADDVLKGVISDHDLLVSRGNNAAVLIKELHTETRVEKKKKLIAQFDAHIKNLVLHNHPIHSIGQIVQSFNRILLQGILQEELKECPGIKSSDFCWLALGSVARGEQIIRTDFDSGIVLTTENENHREVIKQMADRVFEKLKELGFHDDKAGIQANNEEWIMSLAQWKQKFKSWISEPTERALLNATIFFDLMPFYGATSLAEELQKHIYSTYHGNKRFTAFLAQNALQNPPPLGFFKNLVLEKSGEHKNAFDIKARAMMPLADAARLQALEHNCMFPANTISRYQRLLKVDALHAPKYEDCAVAYEIFMRARATEGLQHSHDGRYIDPAHLTHLEKQVLKKAFDPISSIQHLINPT